MNPTEEIHFSKKGRREMSDFVAHELLYDFLIGSLDEERRHAFEVALNHSREGNSELQKMRNSIEYTDMLANTIVSEKIIQQIKLPSSYIDVLLRKLRVENWHAGVKLSLEVIAVAVFVVLIALVIPWSTLVSRQISNQEIVTLAQMEKSTAVASLESAVESQTQETKETQFPDDAENRPKISNIEKTEADKKAPEPQVPAPAQATTAATVVTTIPTNKIPPVAQREGFIYRGTISVVNLAASNPKVIETISALGARKAGQVDLGRIKNNSSYFHMTVPESRLEELKTAFAEYGELKFTKEKHDRIMPEGIVRIIIDMGEKQGSP